MTASINDYPDKTVVGKASATRNGVMSRRKLGSLLLSLMAAGLFTRAARQAAPEQPQAEYVIVNGWLLRSDDLI